VGHAAIPWSIAPLFEFCAGWTTPKSTQHPLIIGKPGGQDVEPSGHGAGGGENGVGEGGGIGDGGGVGGGGEGGGGSNGGGEGGGGAEGEVPKYTMR
jgi:hypothetical protein